MTIPELAGAIVASGTIVGGLAMWALKRLLMQIVTAQERIPSEQTMASIAAALHKVGDIDKLVDAHTFQIRIIEAKSDAADIAADKEHMRLSTHIANTTGDQDVLSERITVLEVRLGRKNGGLKGHG